MARQPIEEIEARLRSLRVPDHVIARHLDAVRRSRRIKRKRFVEVWEDGHKYFQIRRTAPEPV
jgi:hypothetical protein